MVPSLVLERDGAGFMKFTKMHGAGNDYVYVNGFAEKLVGDLPSLARAISDRRFGVGGDGLILILPSDHADARMRMFNADGSESEMCGMGFDASQNMCSTMGLSDGRRFELKRERVYCQCSCIFMRIVLRG